MDLRAEIEQFVLDVIADVSGREVDDIKPDESLLDSGLLDSLGILKLVSFLGEEKNIDLPLEELQLEDFASLDLICALVERHRTA